MLQGRDGRVLAVARGVQGEFKHRDPRFLFGRSAAPRSVPAAALPEPKRAAEIDEATYRFEQFPEYEELQQRIQLAAAFGLKNPYFNVHERVTNDTTVIAGREMINFSSYNYLGISGDPVVYAAAQGRPSTSTAPSVSASRVASGEKPLHRELERSYRRGFFGTEDAMVFVGGHATNVTAIGHLFGAGDLILHDALAHDSHPAGRQALGRQARGRSRTTTARRWTAAHAAAPQLPSAC